MCSEIDHVVLNKEINTQMIDRLEICIANRALSKFSDR